MSRRRGAPLLAVLALLLGMVGAVAAVPTAAHADDGDLVLEIDGVSPAVLRSDDTLTVTGRISNTTDDELDAPVVRLAMQLHVPASREALASWLDGTTSLNVSVLAATTADDPVPAGGSIPFSIELATAGGTFSQFSAWGPRGVEIQASTQGLTATDRTTLLWYPTDPPLQEPADIAVLVPLTPTAQEWRTAVADGVPVGEAAAPRLLRVLDAIGGRSSLAVDPVLLETVVPSTVPPTESEESASTTGGTTDGPGTDAPDGDAPDGPEVAQQAELIGRLAATGSDLVSLGYADADLSALASHATGASLWDAGVSRGRELFDGAGLTVRDIAWPGGAVALDSLDVLTRSGAEAVVLEGDGPALVDATSAHVLVDGADIEALLADDPLSQSLVTSTLAGANARQATLSLSAITTRALPQPSGDMLVVAPREIGVDGALLERLVDRLGALADAPWLELTGVTDLVDDEGQGGARVELPATSTSTGGLDAADLDAIVSGRDVIASYAQAAGPEIVTGHLPALLAPLSNALTVDGTTRDELLRTALTAVDELATSIRVESSSDRWLISDAAAMPVTITNSLDVPATVYVELAPTQPWLQVPEIPEYTLAANSTETFRIPISSVTSGDAIVGVHVTPAPGGPDLAAPASFSLRVRADWENIGTGVVAGLLVIAFVYGLVRTIRRGGRRADVT